MKFSSNDKAKAINYLQKLFDLKANFEIKRLLPARTNQQNRYLHLILNWFAIESGYDLYYVKQILFKQIVNTDIFYRESTNKKTGEIYSYYRSTANLDTKETVESIQKFRIYSSREADIYLPDAGENEFLIHIQNEIEKYNQYL